MEVRKTKPEQISVPFKVYVYASKSGHVIGAFTCDKIERYYIAYEWNPVLKEKSCLSFMQLHRYAGEQGYVYGWHIRDFENWDIPLSVREFIDSKGNAFKRPPQSWAYAVRR